MGIARSLSDIAVRDEMKEGQADARPQATKNRRRIRWNALRIFLGREQSRCLDINRRSRKDSVGQAPRARISPQSCASLSVGLPFEVRNKELPHMAPQVRMTTLPHASSCHRFIYLTASSTLQETDPATSLRIHLDDRCEEEPASPLSQTRPEDSTHTHIPAGFLSIACAFCLVVATGCATRSLPQNPEDRELLAFQAADALSNCEKDQSNRTNTVNADRFKLNVRICIAYSGDGSRPLDPWNPLPTEVRDLEAGEVYFMAIISDSAAQTQKLTIQSDLIRDMIRSREYLYDYDLYYGSPTDSLDVYIGVFDDDGWPSGRTEQLKTLEKSLGKVLELYPPAAPAIPFIQPVLDLVPALMDLFDPDDNLISGRIIITKHTVQIDGKDQTQWKLENPMIHNDNGKIVLKITP